MKLWLDTLGRNNLWVDVPYIGLMGIPTPDYIYCYRLSEEGETLIRQWHWEKDKALISGVLADWLEDHTDDLLAEATGPSDPSIRLRQLIDFLRSRFHSKFPS